MEKFKDWNYNKRVRELIGDILSYEIHAQREIENNKVAREDKVRNNSQRYLQKCYLRYKEFTKEEYPNPKFKIEKTDN